jgi:hypothetical protein
MRRAARGHYAETLHSPELSHALDVLCFRLVQSFRVNC